MSDASKTVERWRSTIADLNKKRETAEGRIAKLQERKSPVTLAACTGNAKAQEKLAALNSELLTERQGVEDIEEAVRQAEGELAKAEEALAVEQESERLKLLARLATERIKAASLVDQRTVELAQALASYSGLGDQLYRHIGSRDDAFGAKVRSTGRADGAVAHRLASFLGCITRIPKDSRDGPTLEAMEADQLSRLLIDPDKALEIASMSPPGKPESEPESDPESKPEIRAA